MLTGLDPMAQPLPGFQVTATQQTPGIDAWEISPAFALNLPSGGLTNVLTRHLWVSRTSPWQQLFVSSDPSGAASWALDGLELSWVKNVDGEGGSAAMSPSGDSLRLGLGTNRFDVLPVEPFRPVGYCPVKAPVVCDTLDASARGC
jgi:hypothetical protein